MSVDLALSVSLPNNFRVVFEIEQTLRRGADTPHIKYDKGKVEEHKLKIQGILGTLDATGSPLDSENLSMSARAPQLALRGPPVVTSVIGDGMSSTPPSPVLYGILIAPRHPPLSQLQRISLWTFGQTCIHSA